MIRNLATVGGMTLLSRVTGFARDVLLAALLGASAANDAFQIAFRLPNHFRAIFGEGAFNKAYVPAYVRTLQTEGAAPAKSFASRVFTLLLVSQIALLAVALLFTPSLVDLLAPGFRDEPDKHALAVSLTRITFPYLLCVTLVTLQSGTLNAHGRFAVAAFAPVLLNVAMIAALALSFLFPSVAHAAAWGVLASGVLQLLLVGAASRRAGVLEGLARPRLDPPVRRFFRALGPAVIGYAGVQIAMFADTIIGSLLPTGGVSSIYYADRLYQLPIGVIGIAAGTVLTPEMSRAFAADDPRAAHRAQNRALAVSLVLAAPFFVAFLLIPDFLTRAAFLRGRFNAEDALAAARVLAAYGVGLLPIVLIASAVASFQSRGDTTTPMLVALAAVAGNVALKVVLFQPMGAPGLALATSVGAWINVLALLGLAWRGGWFAPDRTLAKVALAVAVACGVLAQVAMFGRAPARQAAAFAGPWSDIAAIAMLGSAGFVAYAIAFLVAARLAGLDLAALRPRRGPRGRTQ